MAKTFLRKGFLKNALMYLSGTMKNGGLRSNINSKDCGHEIKN